MNVECRECRAGMKQAREVLIAWWCPEHGQSSIDAARLQSRIEELEGLLDDACGHLEHDHDCGHDSLSRLRAARVAVRSQEGS